MEGDKLSAARPVRRKLDGNYFLHFFHVLVSFSIHPTAISLSFVLPPTLYIFAASSLSLLFKYFIFNSSSKIVIISSHCSLSLAKTLKESERCLVSLIYTNLHKFPSLPFFLFFLSMIKIIAKDEIIAISRGDFVALTWLVIIGNSFLQFVF